MADPQLPTPDQRSFEPIENCWFLTGPTASGKTGVGLELAERVGGEILSLDSMAVYRGMDIGTAKPDENDQRRVPHHLLDLVTPDQEYSLSQYVAAAHQAARKVAERGKQVLFVGGTPLYLKALLRGVYPGPPADWEFRRQIEEELKYVEVGALHERLQLVDPLAAARLHPHDKRRIIRALEVHRLTGRPLSHRQTQFEEPQPDRNVRVVTLTWSRETLHARIESRVEQMFAGGWVDEVRRLLAEYGALGRTASQAVGYREIIDHLRGDRNLAATVDAVKARTRQFARRQDTWFRSLGECQHLDPSTARSVSDLTDAVSKMLSFDAPRPWADGIA